MTAKAQEHRARIEALKNQDLFAEFATTELDEEDSALMGALQEDSKRNVLVEIDDDIDADKIAALAETELPEGFFLGSTESLPGLREHANLKPDRLIDTFTMINRAKLSSSQHSMTSEFSTLFRKALQIISFKYRAHRPLLVSNLRWDVAMPETSDVQVYQALWSSKAKERGTVGCHLCVANHDDKGPSHIHLMTHCLPHT